MRITSKQLAELAGVSRGTVDRALNNRGGVKPEVRQRILDIAAEYGYLPMRAGKALVMRETLTVGVLLNSVGNMFFDDIIQGIGAAHTDFSDFSIEVKMVHMKGFLVEEQAARLDELLEEGLSGLLLTPIDHPDIAARIARFTAAGCPVITVNSDIEGSERLAYVGCDYLRSGQTAAYMLGLQLGQRARALIVTGSSHVLGHNQRVYGFTRVLRAEHPQSQIMDVVENEDDERLSARVVRNAFARFPDINAVYFTAGGVMGGVEAVTQAKKFEKPVIVTCDINAHIRGLIQAGTVSATISQQPHLQGYTALKTLLNYLLFSQPPADERIYTKNEIKTKYNM